MILLFLYTHSMISRGASLTRSWTLSPMREERHSSFTVLEGVERLMSVTPSPQLFVQKAMLLFVWPLLLSLPFSFMVVVPHTPVSRSQSLSITIPLAISQRNQIFTRSSSRPNSSHGMRHPCSTAMVQRLWIAPSKISLGTINHLEGSPCCLLETFVRPCLSFLEAQGVRLSMPPFTSQGYMVPFT